MKSEQDMLRRVRLESLQEPACLELMRSFIADHPALWNKDIGAI